MQHLALLFVTTLCSLPYTGASKIVGGHEAKPHSRPYMAYLLKNGKGDCGGSLIHRRWVLTAAHCVENTPSNTVRVRLGVHNISVNDGFVQIFQILKSILHPKYNRNTYENDIRLLKLKGSAMYSSAVRPISLPSDNSDVIPGSPCSVAGWGRLPSNVFSKVLMETDANIINHTECKKRWKAHGHPFSRNMICSASPGPRFKGFSSGDSGGPLVCKGRVEGVVSFSGKIRGNPKTPDVYIRVSCFLPWIRRVIREM